MSGLNYIRFSDRAAFTNAAVETSQTLLSDAIRARQRATFLCAGGSTPAPVYSALSTAPLDWTKIAVGLTDERWVPTSSEGSNHAFIARTLLQNDAKSAQIYPMVTDPSLSASDEAPSINVIYQQHLLPADLMILGMGADAHTLSWFSGADGLQAAMDENSTAMVTAITAKQTETTGIFTTRQTLTKAAVASARNILLLITGDEKRQVFETSTPDSPIRHMIEAASDRLTTYWAP